MLSVNSDVQSGHSSTPTQHINTLHKDVVTDISYDYYGNRLATACSNGHISIVERADGDGWTSGNPFKAHDGAVLRVSWAHPEFGQVLASCSIDRRVRIWEEVERGTEDIISQWKPCTQLVEFRECVRCVAFGPLHLDLKLATACDDGIIRVYEAPDPMSLKHWSNWNEFDGECGKAFCVCWNPSQFDRPMLAVGGTSGLVRVWEYNASVRKWRQVAHPGDVRAQQHEVRDVAWAPAMGRRHHLIAAAVGPAVRVFQLNGRDGNYQRVQLDDFNTPGDDAQVWRVEWNITATQLAASLDNGRVLVWCLDGASGKWVLQRQLDAAEAS